MKATDIKADEYNPYYKRYIDMSSNSDLLTGLRNSLENSMEFYNSIASDKLEHRYEEGKWTVKEVIQHIMDTERIFAYRALRFARQDKTPLSGFEQDDYVPTSQANTRDFKSLLNEYKAIRQATIAMFENFSDDMLTSIGEASGSNMSVRALGFVTIGHEMHHCNVIRERYL